VRSASGIRAQQETAGSPPTFAVTTCATQLLELGLHHLAISVQLGHDDGGALVMTRYGHPSKDAAAERVRVAFKLEPTEKR
jgi:hypothetical protein